MVDAFDEAWKLPGLREKSVVVVELLDKEGNVIGYRSASVNAGATEVTAKDRANTIKALDLDTQVDLRMGRARVAAWGHTHPGNGGPSHLDVDTAIRDANFGSRNYLSTANRNVYLFRTDKGQMGFLGKYIGGRFKYDY